MNIINHITSRFIRPTFRFPALAMFVALTLISPAARASSISWGSAENISGDNDVSTNGALFGAYNVGGTGVSGATVNGVNFQSFAVPNNSNGGTVGNFTISSANQLFSDNSSHGSAQAPFSGLSNAYQTVLASGIASIFSGFSLTMVGLTVGMQYEFQWWCNDSGGNSSFPTTATAGNSVTLQSNAAHAPGGAGQFALGTFTADSATQVINFTLSEVGFLNAFQLREIQGSVGVPEGGDTLGLLALACGGLVILHRKLRPARMT